MHYISYHQTTLFYLSTNDYDTVLKVSAKNKLFYSVSKAVFISFGGNLANVFAL